MKTGYTFDPITNTLTISASFAKRASKVGSEEYDIMLKLRKDYPTLKVMKEEKAKKEQITYKDMEAFINLHRNKEELLNAFKGAKTLSKFHSMPYSFVKGWFTKQFPYFGNDDLKMDNDGCIVVPKSENAEELSEENTPVQPLEVLKNQDTKETEAETPENTPLAEAV